VLCNMYGETLYFEPPSVMTHGDSGVISIADIFDMLVFLRAAKTKILSKLFACWCGII